MNRLHVMFFLLVPLFTFAQNSHQDQSAYTIETTDGQEVLISADELATAYKRMMEDTEKVNVFFENDDGTISVVNPKIMYAGKLTNIDATIDSGIGACKFYQLGPLATVDYYPEPNPDALVFDPNKGHVKYFLRGEDHSARDIFETVTCHPKSK